MKSYDEYCPIAMGAEVIGDRWTPLILRELICGSERFSDLNRGVPRISKTLLAQRLKQLERRGLVERRPGPTYHLTQSGKDLEGVVRGMGLWAMQWLFGDPAKEHLDGTHLLWRVRQGVIPENLPPRRTVVQFDFLNAAHGKRVWLLLEQEGTSACERDEGWDVDIRVTADIVEFMRIWAGRSTWDAAVKTGALKFDGPRALTKQFPSWFALSPFASFART